MPKTILVTGVSRGIGRKLAQRLAADGHGVIGTVRNSDSARPLRESEVAILHLDLAEPGSFTAFARRLKGLKIDVLIHNAAIGGDGPSLEGLSIEELEANYRTNAIGPILLTQALLPNLRAGSAKQVVAVSSTAGSVSTNETRGGWFAYRASKTALNQLFRTMALQLGPQGFTCVLLSPGWVRTDMGGPRAPLSAKESADGMVSVLKRLTPADNSRFLDYRGLPAPW